jgi:hypothetical protein
MAELPLKKAICRAFSIALLVSGDMTIAEESVLEAVRSLDPEDLTTDALFVCVSTLAIHRSSRLLEQATEPHSSEMLGRLPAEMQNLLKLSRALRQCFVLRILLGLPRNICASLLNLQEFQIADLTCDALSSLAVQPLDEERNFLCVGR